MESTSRRTFLKTGSAAFGAAAFLGACDKDEQPTAGSRSTTPSDFDPTDWASVRAQFDLDPSHIHLAAFVLASHPRQVRDAIQLHRDELDKNTDVYLTENQGQLDGSVLQALAAYLGVMQEEIALTDSTTMGLGLLYNGMRLNEGDELLATTHDFYSTHESLRLAAERYDASFRKVPLFHDPSRATVEEIATNVRKEIRANTRVLAVTWVHSSTGMKLPIQAIADTLADVNNGREEEERVLLCVDGVHGFGNQDIDGSMLGCDFLVSGCHKWLFGPRGTGFVWGRADAWSRVSPTIPSFSGAGISAWLEGLDGPVDLTPGPIQTPGGFHSFEHRWALKDALDFHAAIGRERVAERTASLAERLKEGLADIEAVRVVTPSDPELSAGIVCFEVDGQPPPAVLEALKRTRRIVASVTPYLEQFVRMGPSIVTSEEDIDETLAALHSLV
jgi:selenocysteine lyase/cysteine desulfurase